MDGSGDARTMLGLDGFVVLVTTEEEGELFVLVETMAREVGCPSCGVVARGHGRTLLQVRDLPIGGRAMRLLWRKRRFLCAEDLCPKRSFSEESELVEDCLTRRAAKEICRRVGEEGHSVASVAREFGIGWWRAMAAVRRHGEPLVEDPSRLEDVRELGVDEHKMLSASRRRNTFYATSFVDIEHGRLLDVVPGRSGDDVAYWLYEAGTTWRSGISTVAIDPHRAYANGLLRYVEKATVTIDHFHAIKLANEAINDVRRRVQNDTLSRRGRKDDPLYRTRRLMTRGFERLSEHQRAKLFAALQEGDPAGEVSAAVLGKELLRDLYTADGLEDARRRLSQFYAHVEESEVGELTRLGKTVRAWETEILNYHCTGASNGATEAQNLITEKIRRIGHGFRNFRNYRLRLLLHSGVEWDTRPTARIRGRQPRLAA